MDELLRRLSSRLIQAKIKSLSQKVPSRAEDTFYQGCLFTASVLLGEEVFPDEVETMVGIALFDAYLETISFEKRPDTAEVELAVDSLFHQFKEGPQ